MCEEKNDPNKEGVKPFYSDEGESYYSDAEQVKIFCEKDFFIIQSKINVWYLKWHPKKIRIVDRLQSESVLNGVVWLTISIFYVEEDY